jgi:hypothetical protein
VDLQAGNTNPNPQPESMAAGTNGVSMAADTNIPVAGSDGYAANDARIIIDLERMIARLGARLEGTAQPYF